MRGQGDEKPSGGLVMIETKSSTVADDLRGTENQKIHYGKRHFTSAWASIATKPSCLSFSGGCSAGQPPQAAIERQGQLPPLHLLRG
jgi:hypothetical protein